MHKHSPCLNERYGIGELWAPEPALNRSQGFSTVGLSFKVNILGFNSSPWISLNHSGNSLFSTPIKSPAQNHAFLSEPFKGFIQKGNESVNTSRWVMYSLLIKPILIFQFFKLQYNSLLSFYLSIA